MPAVKRLHQESDNSGKAPYMNQTIIKMAIAKELDGALINPFENSTMTNILVAEPMAERGYFSINTLSLSKRVILNKGLTSEVRNNFDISRNRIDHKN